jgi:cell fate regulator YaaT (PSP1 superfamily)
MAKDQGLSLNPTKISGICGRLMCCLQYEQAAYEDLLKKVPGKGSLVEYEGQKGNVTETFVLKGLIKVRFGTPEEPTFKILDAKDVKILKKGKSEPVEDIPEELKED